MLDILIGIRLGISTTVGIRSVFNALSIGRGLVAAVLLCIKRED